MSKRDYDGWKDESTTSFSRPRAREERVSGHHIERDPTQQWDGALGEQGQGDDRLTIIPETLRELYGLLVVLSGPRRFDILKICQRKVTIGRTGTDLVLDDSAVGRQHAVLTVGGNDETDAEFRILDRGADGLPSKTGTLINGKHVTEAMLRDRDRIKLGETLLLFIRLWPEVR